MTLAPPMKTKAIAGWFGSNRMLAARVGAELGKLAWCGVPFVGGAPELPFIKTRGGLAADLHRHLINLARCVSDQDLLDEMLPLVDRVLFHPDELGLAQARCRGREAQNLALFGNQPAELDDPEWAADYFVCAWMSRGGFAGKNGELNQSLSVRFTASGGGSAVRYRSAVESLTAWHDVLKRWEFCVLDCFEFLDRVRDQEGHGLYVDAPWPDAGDEYRFPFTEAKQRRLAERLARFNHVRIVVRFGDHPLIRELYQPPRWNWVTQTSRNQQKVLILNGTSLSRDGKGVA